MSHWFMTQVAQPALHAAVYTLSGGLVTTLILAPFRGALRKVWRAVDSLDPDTDTGVTRQLKHVEAKLSARPQAHETPLKREPRR